MFSKMFESFESFLVQTKAEKIFNAFLQKFLKKQNSKAEFELFLIIFFEIFTFCKKLKMPSTSYESHVSNARNHNVQKQ